MPLEKRGNPRHARAEAARPRNVSRVHLLFADLQSRGGAQRALDLYTVLASPGNERLFIEREDAAILHQGAAADHDGLYVARFERVDIWP